MKDIIKAQTCLQRLVVTYNIFFWLTGPGILGLGIWFFIVLDEYQPIVARHDFSAPAFFITVGGATSVIAGIVGCLGGVNEHKRLLRAYFLLMFIVCALEVSACVYAFILYGRTERLVSSTFSHSLTAPSSCHAAVIDEIQTEHKCCGIDSPSDWLRVNNTEGSPRDSQSDLPESCCAHDVTGHCNLEGGSWREGCLSALVLWVKDKLMIAGWSSFAMACTQLLALAVICCFTKAVSFMYY